MDIDMFRLCPIVLGRRAVSETEEDRSDGSRRFRCLGRIGLKREERIESLSFIDVANFH